MSKIEGTFASRTYFDRSELSLITWVLRRVFCSLLCGLLLRSALAGSSPTTTWINPSLGDWYTESNWDHGLPSSGFVPTSAQISNGGSSLINRLTTGIFGGPAPAGADILRLGVVAGTTGTLLVTNGGGGPPGELDVDGLYVGGTDLGSNTTATGTLTISNGGFVGNAGRTDQGTVIGGGPKGVGTVTATGSGSEFSDRYTITAGLFGRGTLQVQNGAYASARALWLGEEAGSLGFATIDGAGSTFVTGVYYSDPVRVGIRGQGTLQISNGGMLDNTGVEFSELQSWIATDPGSTGAATVTGSGSSWRNTGNLLVGGRKGFSGANYATLNGGTALLQITSGGFVSTTGMRVLGATSTVRVDNGSSTVTGLAITGAGGQQPPAGGTFGELTVGLNTGGRMEIRDGGTVGTSRGYIGFNSGSDGFVGVTDAGSRWDCTGSLFVGNGGNGTLEIRNGGYVISAGNAYLGFSNGSSGSVIVSGTGSTLALNANLWIGGNGGGAGGQGVLLIDNGGAVGAAATTVYGNGFLQLGANATLNGPVTFVGGGIQTYADVNFTNDFALGNGVLIVYTLAHNPTFSGSISGSGGLSLFVLGTQGALTLSGDSTYTGATNIPNGTLLVNGSITSDVTVSNGGTLGGGGFVGSVTVNNGGIVAPGNSPGRLTVNGNYTQTSGGRLNIEIGGNIPGADYDQLDITGTASLDGTLNLTLVNGFTPAVGDTFSIIASAAETGNFSQVTANGVTVTSGASGGGVVLTVTAVSPELISAVSRKVHGNAGTFDIDLSRKGPPGVECRAGGPAGSYQVVLTFADVVTVGGVSIASEDGLATAQGSVNGTEVTVDLSGVTNAQVLGITLNAVSDGVSIVDVLVPMGVLVGDTTGNGAANGTDIGQTKSLSGQATTALNFRSDVNASGTINATDIGQVKAQSGTSLPP